MSKDKKQPMPDHAAIQADVERRHREIQEKNRKAQLLRIDYVIGLLDVGLDEQMVLDYTKEAILPRATYQEITPEDAARNRDELLKFKADLQNMGSGIITQ